MVNEQLHGQKVINQHVTYAQHFFRVRTHWAMARRQICPKINFFCRALDIKWQQIADINDERNKVEKVRFLKNEAVRGQGLDIEEK